MGRIEIINLNQHYANTTILDNLNETIEDGETYAIVGASGAGKTTLVKIIAGLSLITSGMVKVDWKNIFDFTSKEMLQYHKNSGLVFQNAALINNMTIYENLTLFYHYHTNMKEDEIFNIINYYLEYVGFDDDLSMRPATLSTGEKMLVNIVRAISHNPKYIYWDEPFAHLDTMVSRKVKDLMVNMKKERKTMILITHDLEFAFKISDRVGILHEGKILESGTPQDIMESKLEITKRLLG